MRTWFPDRMIWQLGWIAVVLVGALVIVRYDIAQRRDMFQTNARIAHGVLSQRAVQHEAILNTLVLLSPKLRPEQRLPAVYPQVLAVHRRDAGDTWSDPAFESAESRSREVRHAVLGTIDQVNGQYSLVLAGEPTSFALNIDVLRMVNSGEWPLAPVGSIRAVLEYADKSILLHQAEPAEAQPAGLTAGFVFEKPLAAVSQPFVLRLSRATGPAQWPWTLLLAWAGSQASRWLRWPPGSASSASAAVLKNCCAWGRLRV